MLNIYIFLILLNYLSLSFQTIKTALLCDDRVGKIFVYDENRREYKPIYTVTSPENCYNVDYVDLNVDPGDLIKFECINHALESLGAGCFLINGQCRCYDFEIVRPYSDYSGEKRRYNINFNNGITYYYDAKFLKEKIETIYEYKHRVPLDVAEINCNSKTISAPINIKRTLRFSNFIEYPFRLTNLNISINSYYQIFTLNNQPLSSSTKFNILSNLEYSSDQSKKINIDFINYSVVLSTYKYCRIYIRFCYDSCFECKDINPDETFHQCLKCKDDFYFIDNTSNCMTIEEMENSSYYYFDNKNKIFKSCFESCKECYFKEPNETSHQCSICKDDFYFIENTSNCMTKKEMENYPYYFDNKTKLFSPCYDSCQKCNDIEPNETSHQCLKCKDDFYFIENTSNCMKKEEMENSSYYFDNNKEIFKQCLNECSTCDNETYCKICSEDYHFIYNEIGKCISEPNKEDLLYLDHKNNTYLKCPEGTKKVVNNECIKSSNISLIIILTIVILIIVIVLFFFIKRYISRKKLESEIAITFGKNTSDNQLINVFL